MKNILKHKNKIIVGTLIVAVLAFAFWWGGDSPSLRGWNPNETSVLIQTHLTAEEKMQLAEEIAKSKGTPTPTEETLSTENVETPATTEDTQTIDNEQSPTTEPNNYTNVEPFKTPEKTEPPKNNTEYSKEQGMEIDQSTGKDEYQTNPVPEGKPIPVNPEDTKVTDKALTCTLSVRCDTILQNTTWLKEEKVDIVPEDGVIFAEKEVVFYEGESVFNVIFREMKKNKIHFEFVNTPIYNSAYIEGIGNLYEFDCGELSGWMYKVNGWFPNYGCSRYALKHGDKIEWLYTCDLGNDIGGGSVAKR